MRLTGAVPFEPPYGVLRRTGMIQLLAVSGALGGATLVALIRSGIAWPLGAFVATASYVALATFELTLLGSHESAKSDAIGLTPTGWKDPYRGHATASPSTQRQAVEKLAKTLNNARIRP